MAKATAWFAAHGGKTFAVELDKTYREVARRLPNNPDVRFEKVKGKEELILTPLGGFKAVGIGGGSNPTTVANRRS